MTTLDVEGAHAREGARRPATTASTGSSAPHGAAARRARSRSRRCAEQQGFRNSGNEHRIVDNGTFLDNTEIAPILGMDRNGAAAGSGQAPQVRAAAGAAAGEARGRERARNFNGLRHDSDWVNSDITVSTDGRPDRRSRPATTSRTRRRTAGARSATAATRRSSTSSRCSRRGTRCAKDRWNDVELAVYYDPAHDYNVERMHDGDEGVARLLHRRTSARSSSARCASSSSRPTQDFAQSFANTIPYSEGIGFIADYRDPEKIDMVTYVTAHEIAHQWWGHQVIERRPAGRDDPGRVARAVLGADGDGADVRAGADPQVPEVRARQLPARARRRGARGAAARARREPGLHPLPEGRRWRCTCSRTRSARTRSTEALRGLLARVRLQVGAVPELDGPACAASARSPARSTQQLITDLFEKITLYDVKVTDAKCEAPGRRPLGRHARRRRPQALRRRQGQGDRGAARRSRSTSACSRSSRAARVTTSRACSPSSGLHVHSGKQTLRAGRRTRSRTSPASIRSTSASTATRTTT